MENWKSIKGYEGLYEVSDKGNVRRIPSHVPRGNHIRFVPGNAMIPMNNGKGYLRVYLTKNNKGKKIMLHRIIAEAWIPNPEGKKVVNHKNGIKVDNRIENLEWCSQSENCLHAHKTGLIVIDARRRLQMSERVKKQPRGYHGQLVRVNQY